MMEEKCRKTGKSVDIGKEKKDCKRESTYLFHEHHSSDTSCKGTSVSLLKLASNQYQKQVYKIYENSGW